MSSINRILLSGCLEKRKEKKIPKKYKIPYLAPFFPRCKSKIYANIRMSFLRY